jgi:hypothetical protein
MTLIELLLLLLVLAVLAFTVFYLLQGSKGKIDIRRPVESRVDEYLDRRFEAIIGEWSLVTRPKLRAFRDNADLKIGAEETRVAALGAFEKKMTADLDSLEARLDALEQEGSPKASRRS